MSDSPKISVLIPCHNLGAYLDEAVDSVLAQTYRDFEILIVDDGSTDAATREMLADYQRPQTTVFRTENRGLAAARNFLIARARGEFISALDADDRYHPQFLARTVARLGAEPELTFVSCWLEIFGEETREWRQERCDLVALLAECTVATPALVRRAAVVAAGGYDENMPAMGDEDWDLWLTLVERGGRGVILPEVLFHYRRRAGSMFTACNTGAARQKLMDYMVAKHAASYDRHLEEVLAFHDAQVVGALRENYRLERKLDAVLRPEIARRRAQLERLRAKCAAVERQAGEQRKLAAEVAKLHASTSWRVTAPLRSVARILKRLYRGS